VPAVEPGALAAWGGGLLKALMRSSVYRT